MSVLRAIAVFLCGVYSLRLIKAQIIFPGTCPDVQAMSNFNPTRYLGKWYEAEKYFFLFEHGGKCITADYTLKDNGAIGVTNKQIKILTGGESEIQGEANLVGKSDEGKLSVRFPSVPLNIAAPYWVVDTDYDSYAVVWSCYELGFLHSINAWILTRERNPPQSVLDKAFAAVDRSGISRAFFLKTDQYNCPDLDN